MIDVTTFTATAEDSLTPLANDRLTQVIGQFTSPQPIRQPTGAPRDLPPVVRDLIQAVIQEAQRGNVEAGNFLEACDVGAIGSGDVPPPDCSVAGCFPSHIRTIITVSSCDRSSDSEIERRPMETDSAKRAS
jgi:hypothetical protein